MTDIPKGQKSLGEKLWDAMSDPKSTAWLSMDERERANFERIAIIFCAQLSHDETTTALLASERARSDDLERALRSIQGIANASLMNGSKPL
jgi:hypothetical protein